MRNMIQSQSRSELFIIMCVLNCNRVKYKPVYERIDGFLQLLQVFSRFRFSVSSRAEQIKAVF